MSGSLLLILALIGIVLTGVLWFELLLRNAAVAVLIATSPISAVGQMSDATRGWWPTLVSATIRLIVLKPAIALVMMLGFSIAARPRPRTATTLSPCWPACSSCFSPCCRGRRSAGSSPS